MTQAPERPTWNPVRSGGACSSRPDLTGLFFPEVYDEDAPVVIPPAVTTLCSLCPVNADCLQWAIDTDEFGFWAGTSRYQRHQLTKTRSRVKCPGCGSQSVMSELRGQVCLACGISWVI